MTFEKKIFSSLFKLSQLQNLDEVKKKFIIIMDQNFSDLNLKISNRSDKNANIKFEIKIEEKSYFYINIYGDKDKFEKNKKQLLEVCINIFSLIINNLHQKIKSNKITNFEKNVHFKLALDMFCIAKSAVR